MSIPGKGLRLWGVVGLGSLALPMLTRSLAIRREWLGKETGLDLDTTSRFDRFVFLA